MCERGEDFTYEHDMELVGDRPDGDARVPPLRLR
jgi:hypothetical protein